MNARRYAREFRNNLIGIGLFLLGVFAFSFYFFSVIDYTKII